MLLRPSVQHQAEAGRRPELTFEPSIPPPRERADRRGGVDPVARTAKPRKLTPLQKRLCVNYTHSRSA